MMRSLYSAVSGLKTHQTKMDVLGNNIANVNTVAFKSTSVTFATIMYQTLSNASGANAEQGLGGVNAKQIGLGVSMASTQAAITTAGAAETTGRAFDLKVTDKSTSSFFIVNNGSENVFTKAGSFYVDGAGNLCMTTTGYTVMGWQVDPNSGEIRKDTVSALKVMSAENQTSSPEATTEAKCTGVIDNNSSTVSGNEGYLMNLNIYDNLGYSYTARFSVKAEDPTRGEYTINLTDVIDKNGESILTKDIKLRDLFGTGAASSTQGSGVFITDNYNFMPGKSKSDIRDAITKNATTDEGRLYTYKFDADDINGSLQLTGKKALPSGYTVEFTSSKTSATQAIKDLLRASGDTGIGTKAKGGGTDTNNSLVVRDGAGNVVALGAYADATEGAGGQWTFKEVELDVNTGTYTIGADADYSLTQSVTIKDFIGLGTEVVDATGEYTGYSFEGEQLQQLADALNMKLDEAPFDGAKTLYYWSPEDLAVAEGGKITLDTGLSFTATNPADLKDETSVFNVASGATEGTLITSGAFKYTYGVEDEGIMSSYAYTTINGADLANNTEEPIFSEELPADAVVRFSMFNGTWSIRTPESDGFKIQFNTTDGTLSYIGSAGNTNQSLNLSKLVDAGYDGFSDIDIDFSALLNYNNNGSSTAAMAGGDLVNSDGKGKKLGALIGLSVDNSGKVFGSYDNGNTQLIGQIAVAQFANAAGLESTGDNCYRTTLNSGDFDGIGVEITADGSSISTGELEMSNVDLAGEFTAMITTQRGFQANSRVITTSDSMLEELINLKR